MSQKGNTIGEGNSCRGLEAYEQKDISINEILYNPNSGFSEFVELVNNSQKPININGWKIYDNDELHNLKPNRTILPGEFFVIASDSSLIP